MTAPVIPLFTNAIRCIHDGCRIVITGRTPAERADRAFAHFQTHIAPAAATEHRPHGRSMPAAASEQARTRHLPPLWWVRAAPTTR